jgi:hypothetical protein
MTSREASPGFVALVRSSIARTIFYLPVFLTPIVPSNGSHTAIGRASSCSAWSESSGDWLAASRAHGPRRPLLVASQLDTGRSSESRGSPAHERRPFATGIHGYQWDRDSTPEAIRAATQAVLRDPSYRANAERIRDEITSMPGQEMAVELLERLARDKAPIIASYRKGESSQPARLGRA